MEKTNSKSFERLLNGLVISGLSLDSSLELINGLYEDTTYPLSFTNITKQLLCLGYSEDEALSLISDNL